MRLISSLGIGLLACALSACQPQSDEQVPEQKPAEPVKTSVPAMVYSFVESEPGIDPYPVRMIITPDYMRMDEGKSEDNYLLFDRQSKTIHSVTHQDQRILRISRKLDLLPVPESVDLSEKRTEAKDLPLFAGKKPERVAFLSGDKVCYEVVAVNGFGGDAVSAMREYLITLSGEQVQNLDKTPSEMRSDCMMANLIYAPVRHLEAGFPLREWDYNGYVRELVNVEEAEVQQNMFGLDPAYQIYELSASGMPAVVN